MRTNRQTKPSTKEFRSNVKKHRHGMRQLYLLKQNVEVYGASIEIDHAHNVCISGSLNEVNIPNLNRYLRLEGQKIADILMWSNRNFMMILQ